jgi:hypothetical protein
LLLGRKVSPGKPVANSLSIHFGELGGKSRPFHFSTLEISQFNNLA